MAKLFRRILVPHDFSAAASRALVIAGDLAATHGGTLTVLHAIAPYYGGVGFVPTAELPWVPTKDMERDLRLQLERLVGKKLGARAKRARTRVVLGDPLQAILDAARRADVIVMATLGRSGLSHLLMGSIAEKIVRHSPVPVLTIRPAAARGGSGRGRSRSRPRGRAA